MNFDRQLYESGLTAQGSYDKMDQYDQEAIIRFAELIVRECAEVASSYDGAYYVGTAIEKHFGVEE